MKLMDRDKEIIEFVKTCGIVDTKTISKIYFNNGLRATQRRLKILSDNKYLKRVEKTEIGEQNLFYLGKKPKQIKHRLLFTKLIGELVDNGAEILKVRSAFKTGNLITDGLVGCKINGEFRMFFVEVDLTKYFKIKKYEELYYHREWKKLFPFFPEILAITDKKVEESENKNIKITKIDTLFTEIKKELFEK